jgi:outer membrane protein insertion porin family
LGFTEPYVFDKNIALGWDIFRRDYNSFNFTGNGNDRRTTYNQVTTGFQLRLGVPLTEFTSLALRYGLSYDDVSLDKSTYFVDTNGDGTKDTCSPVIAGRYLCDALGKRLTSSVGYSFVFDNLNNRLHPTRGQRVVFSQDLAGLGGDVRYIKSTVEAHKYWGFGKGFVFSVNGEGGYIKGLGQDVRLTDRFFLGEPQIRGFDIRGIGPRIKRTYLQDDLKTPLSNSNNNISDDALGGRAYYLGRLELELPLGSGGRELGLRPSIFMDAGAVFGIRRPNFQSTPTPGLKVPALDSSGRPLFIDNVTGASTTSTTASDGTPNKALNSVDVPAFVEQYLGNSAKPRLSIGFGVNWNSPFGPFRIDVAKALLKQKGDDTKLFSFNVGTQF